jgi:hypothetical protein
MTKEESLKQAGISVRTANRYEELAGPRLEEAMEVICYY